MRVPVFALMVAMACPLAVATERVFESGPQRTVVVELYTSEGCSSCPPAEAYLNSYVQRSGLWTRYIPLAFHVDYWDYLGWTDRFGRAEHGERQRRYARLGRVRTVYTPAFIVNGQGWRPGFFAREPRPETPDVGRLSVRIRGDRVRATLAPVAALPRPLALHVAVLGMDRSTRIRAGENAGRAARHQFVVLEHRVVTGGGDMWETRLPGLEQHAEPLGLAAWVSGPDDPTPLQATGGYLSPP